MGSHCNCSAASVKLFVRMVSNGFWSVSRVNVRHTGNNDIFPSSMLLLRLLALWQHICIPCLAVIYLQSRQGAHPGVNKCQVLWWMCQFGGPFSSSDHNIWVWVPELFLSWCCQKLDCVWVPMHMVHVSSLGPLMVQQFLQFWVKISSDIVPYLGRSVDLSELLALASLL